MHDQDSQRGELSSPAKEDGKVESAILALLLAEYPAQLTVPELTLAMNSEPLDFAEADAVDRAVGELVGAGLLHRHGAFVLPSRAALYFSRLELD
jgi:hypothetical protein